MFTCWFFEIWNGVKPLTMLTGKKPVFPECVRSPIYFLNIICIFVIPNLYNLPWKNFMAYKNQLKDGLLFISQGSTAVQCSVSVVLRLHGQQVNRFMILLEWTVVLMSCDSCYFIPLKSVWSAVGHLLEMAHTGINNVYPHDSCSI